MPFKAQKYEFVELQVQGVAGGNTGTQFFFSDLPKLRCVTTQAITTYTTNTLSYTPTGNALPTLAVLKNSFLVLYLNERQDVWRLPLLELNRIQNASTDPFVRGLYEFNNVKITWDKSYVQTAVAPANTSNFSFCFGVYYA